MHDDDASRASPRSDAVDAAGWLLLGAAAIVASFTMDRLASQDVPPFAAPGLLPGLLGIGLLLLGGVLLSRSLSRRAGAVAATPGKQRSRAALVIVLCVIFGTILVGHGVPFWLAAAVFVTTAILLLQPHAASWRRALVIAAAIGLGAGGAVTLVFQQLFLVRLP